MFSGKVIALGSSFNGQKKDGTPFRKQEYIIEKVDGKYVKKLAFSVINDKIDEFKIQVGQHVEIEANIESREYNGKWYTEVTAWKVANHGFVSDTPTPQPAYAQQPVYQQQAPVGYQPTVQPTIAAPQPAQNNDLPF